MTAPTPSFDRSGFNREVGLRLCLIRKSQRRTQEWLAGRIGVTRSQIANIEAGRSRAAVDLIWRAAIVLQTRIGKFIPERDV
jgi:transcriptional regulator with XRE-family HTH domain